MPKYKIGQSVFGASASRLNKKQQCPDCLGSAEWLVKTPAGEEFQTRCHTCNEGWHSSGKVANWLWCPVVQPLTIGSVRLDTENPKGESVSYMCVETGIGSGTIHYEKKLFSTKEEAEEYANELAIKIAKEKKQEFEEKRDRNKKKDFCYRKSK